MGYDVKIEPSSNVTISKEYGIHADNFEGVRFIGALFGWPIAVALSCGEQRTYSCDLDVPPEGERCDCGKVPHEHWFIHILGVRWIQGETVFGSMARGC